MEENHEIKEGKREDKQRKIIGGKKVRCTIDAEMSVTFS